MRFYEIRANLSLVGIGGEFGYAVTNSKLQRDRIAQFWIDFWDGQEPEGEIDDYGLEPRYISSGLYKKFLAISGEKKMGKNVGIGRFIIERGGEINGGGLELLQKCFPELKNMSDKY